MNVHVFERWFCAASALRILIYIYILHTYLTRRNININAVYTSILENEQTAKHPHASAFGIHVCAHETSCMCMASITSALSFTLPCHRGIQTSKSDATRRNGGRGRDKLAQRQHRTATATLLCTCTTLPCCLCTYVCTSSSAKRAKVSYYRRGEKPMPITRIPAYPPFLESIVSLTHVWLHWCIKCARENLIVMM